MNTERSILFANGRTPPPFNVGGDGVTIDILLSGLAKEGLRVKVIGVVDPTRHAVSKSEIENRLCREKINYNLTESGCEYSFHGYDVEIVSRRDLSERVTKNLDTNSSRITLTQLESSAEVLEMAAVRGVSTVFFVHDAESKNVNDLKKIVNLPNKCLVIFNSLFTQNKFSILLKEYPHQVIYPPIDLHNNQICNNKRTFVTIINPVRVKGGEIFSRLVEKMPTIDFLAVNGWHNPLEEGLNIRKLKNVTVWNKQDNIQNVFQVSKLLMVPSQWEEGFGRVAAEAMANNVPVIASRVGGLVEAVGNGGLLVEDYRNPNAWIEIVSKTLNSPDTLQLLEKRGRKYVGRFSAGKSIKQFITVLDELW